KGVFFMRDISEISGDTEQAKQTGENTPKTRLPGRSKPDTTSSQDQETKTPTRRRPSTPRQHNTENAGEPNRPPRNDMATGTPRPASQDGPSTSPRPAPQGGSAPYTPRSAGGVSSYRNTARPNTSPNNPTQRP